MTRGIFIVSRHLTCNDECIVRAKNIKEAIMKAKNGEFENNPITDKSGSWEK